MTREHDSAGHTGNACPSPRVEGLLDGPARCSASLTAKTPEWGVTKLATALGLPESTTFDIVASFVQTGLLQETLDARHRPGWRVLLTNRRMMKSSCCRPRVHRTLGAHRGLLRRSGEPRWRPMLTGTLPPTTGGSAFTSWVTNCPDIAELAVTHTVGARLGLVDHVVQFMNWLAADVVAQALLTSCHGYQEDCEAAWNWTAIAQIGSATT
ncbi:MAG: helix-turn-helix domain-containing protein [Mycobacterium sp.]